MIKTWEATLHEEEKLEKYPAKYDRIPGETKNQPLPQPLSSRVP
jgi:hypothetical protein